MYIICYQATPLGVQDIEEQMNGEPASSDINDASHIDSPDCRQPGEETTDNAILSQPDSDDEEIFAEYAQITLEFKPQSPTVQTDFNLDRSSESAEYSGVNRGATEYAQLTSETRSPPHSATYTELKQKTEYVNVTKEDQPGHIYVNVPLL